MTYTVKYRKHGQWFWRTIRKVKGDLCPTDLPGMRVLIRENEERVEIPTAGTEFWFSHERFLGIKQQMEREARQKLPM